MFIPAAGSPLSAFTPPRVGALPPPAGVLSRKFDTSTRDVADLFTGEDPTDAALRWQLTIRRGSGAALGDNGNELHLIRKATDDAPVRLRDEAKRVVRKYERRGDIADVEVIAEAVGTNTATAAVQISCRNTHTEATARVRGGG